VCRAQGGRFWKRIKLSDRKKMARFPRKLISLWGFAGLAGVIKNANRCMVSCLLEPVGRAAGPGVGIGGRRTLGGTPRAAGKGYGWGGFDTIRYMYYSNKCVWDESPSVSSRGLKPRTQSLFLWRDDGDGRSIFMLHRRIRYL
jgi:hypothetical protein